MANPIMQTILWIAAGVLLLAYLKRRRNRKMNS
jgi:hypothetical protein